MQCWVADRKGAYCGDNPRLMVSHILTLATRRSCLLVVLERSPPVCLLSMDAILRLLEGLT